jgi:uncharacterized protein YecE (DUF72 family)
MRRLWIGTSGWTYKGWRGPFYPDDVPMKKWLAWYTGRFSTTEINGSFYRTPSLEAVYGWREQTPDDFLFAWKASKFITHWKRLTEKCANSLELMETRLDALGPKAGPVLFQLPGSTRSNSAMQAGTSPRFSTCSASTTRHSASPTTVTRRPHGKSRRGMST